MAEGGRSVGPATGCFLVPERFALAKRFRGIGLAAVGFVAFRRAGLEGLRALVRAVDLPLRKVARFLC